MEPYARNAREALDQGRLERAVDWLKKGLRRDPYWSEGHRLLGDLYLFELNHSAYALIQYRKLKSVRDELEPVERLLLARAYHERDFPDRARSLLGSLDPQALPETRTAAGRTLRPRRMLTDLRERMTGREDGDESAFRRLRRRGDEWYEHDNHVRAIEAYERALELREDPEVRVRVAQCYFRRRRWAEAVEALKAVLAEKSDHGTARRLLERIYARLGLSEFYDPGRAPPRDEDDRSERAS